MPRARKTAEAPSATALDKLKELGVEDDIASKIVSDLGVTSPDDINMLNEDDLTGIGMLPIPARTLLAKISPVTPTASTASLSATSLDILPKAPDDGSWLEALKMGGVLKVDPSTVISTVRAALADRVGLYGVPKLLVDEMERFAEQSDEPVEEEYFKLRKQVTQRNYAEIFEAIDGLDGNYVTETRRKQLLSRMDAEFWPAILGFYGQLKSWQELWMQGMSNPGMLLLALASGTTGVAAMSHGLMQPPDTAAVRDSADEVNNALNRVFAGSGVPIAAALAYDATQIRKTLENPRLPALIGAVNRDQMLKQLRIGVSSTYPRMENNLTSFVLGAIELKNIAGNEELQYLAALYMLGSQIQWDQLSSNGHLTGIGGKKML